MTSLETTFSQGAWTQLWQLSLLIVAVGIATRLCRRRPHLAYALWMVVIAKAALPPIWVSNFSLFTQPAMPAWLAMVDDETSMGAATAPSTAAHADAERLRATPSAPTSPVVAAPAMAFRHWAAAWGLGAAVVVAWAAWKIAARNRALADSSPPSAETAALAAKLAKHIGLSKPPIILISEQGLGPAAYGVVRPKIVLPRCVLGDESAALLRPILTHELIHLRRGDHLVASMQFLVQAIWWFHPLVWRANREICRVRELCCDAESVRALDDPPRRYAAALVEALEAKQRLRPVFGYPGVRPVEVTAQRIQEVLTMSDRFQARTPLSYWFVALVTAALALPAGRWTASAMAQKTLLTDEAETAAPADKKPAVDKPTLLLKYGDGKPDGKQSIAGAGEMIRFTLPAGQSNALKSLRVHAARYGHPQPPKEDVEINVLNEDMTETLHTELVPYSLFKRQAECRWTTIPFESEVEVPENFWVVLNFNAEATKGVYVSYDKSTKGEYSRVGFNDQDAKETKFGGDWMVQAILAK